MDDAKFFDRLLVSESVAVKPKQFTQRSCIAAIGLFLAGIFRLDEDNLFAAEVLENFHQPVVKATDFNDRPESAVFRQASLSQLFEEGDDFLGARADLSS